MNGGFHATVHGSRAPQVASSLGRYSLSQVAGSAATVHGFSFGRKPKTLLCAFVRFDLGFAFSLGHQSCPTGMSLNLYLPRVYEVGRITQQPVIGKS